LQTSQIRRVRKERRCDECLRVIRAGETAYIRYHKRYPATYCIECYEKRREKWESWRNSEEKEELVLNLLSNGPVPARKLADALGHNYLAVIRKLGLKGHLIKRKETKDPISGKRVTYYYLHDQK
jgi:hypothetical protein